MEKKNLNRILKILLIRTQDVSGLDCSLPLHPHEPPTQTTGTKSNLFCRPLSVSFRLSTYLPSLSTTFAAEKTWQRFADFQPSRSRNRTLEEHKTSTHRPSGEGRASTNRDRLKKIVMHSPRLKFAPHRLAPSFLDKTTTKIA